MIDAGEHEVVGKLLNELAERMPGRIEPLEWLVETYGRTSDSFRLPDALAHLGRRSGRRQQAGARQANFRATRRSRAGKRTRQAQTERRAAPDGSEGRGRACRP